MSEKRLLTVAAWPHPWPTQAALRVMIARAETNGANAWIVRIGRRVLIDESAFWRWVEAQDPARRPRVAA